VDFELSPRVSDLRDRVRAFMEEHVLPVELEALRALDDEVRPGTPYPEIIVDIRAKAREAGLWNLFMPDERYGAGLTNWEYGIICEETGRSPAIAPMAFNCSAPDTGNMEILAEHGTEEQRAQWLDPLLEGDIRSCFSMTEPEVAGSDPTTLQTRAELVDGEWVINGHKWFTSGAVGASVAIVMCVTDPDAHQYARASMILVPVDKPAS
jgi:acyl-CoA dehydrogenase